jgi:hypothetical protein
MRTTPKRTPVNKHKSARAFKSAVGRTKAPNIAPPPMRGGQRM